MLIRVSIAVGLTIAGLPLVAQQKLSLTRPDAEFAEPYTSLRAVREFADGRVLVADAIDKVVHLIDFRSGAATQIGREGQGPEEYSLPFSLFPTADGGALLQDFGNRRFLPISAEGKIGKAFSTPMPPAQGGTPEGNGPARRMMMMGGGLFNAQGSDGKGHLYFQGIAPPDDEGRSADSVPLMRWTPHTTRVDTVAWLPITPGMRPQVTRGPGGTTMMVRMGGGAAWSKQTAWVVAPDGRIAIVEPEPYRVTWITPTGRVAGPVVPYTPIRVTDADRKEFLEERSRQRPIIARFGGPGGGRVPPVQPNAGDVEFPDTKPAFSGPSAVLVAPDGRVWVQRLRRAGDRTPLYDVFDQQGRKVAEVTLRPRSRVLGFGKGTVYVARNDEDDLQYLERYRLN